MLSSHLRLNLPSNLFRSGFPTKILYTSLPYLIRDTCPAHLILLDLITRTILGEQYTLLSYSLCSFLHSLVTSLLLGLNILLRTLLSKHPQPSSSLIAMVTEVPINMRRVSMLLNIVCSSMCLLVKERRITNKGQKKQYRR